MTVAPGLLDRRVTLYARQDNGADGFIRSVYVKTGTWWGRIDDTSDTQTIPGAPMAHVESRTNAVATVSDAVPVPKFGIARIDDGPLYFVRGVFLKRALRCQKLTLEAVDPTASATFEVYESVDVLDGVHLVEGT